MKIETITKYAMPLASVCGLLIAAGKFEAQVSTLRTDVDAIQTTQPAVMNARLAQQEETSKQINDHLDVMDQKLGRACEDVAFIRGRMTNSDAR